MAMRCKIRYDLRIREGLEGAHFLPRNLAEQLVLQEAMTGSSGVCIIDPTNFPAGGKKFAVQQNGIRVHYMTNRFGIMGDFKFK